MPRKAARGPELSFPRLPHSSWTILGLDLSLTRTGFATLICEGGVASWGGIGSLTPRDPKGCKKQESWVRATALGIAIRSRATQLLRERPSAPLIISIEFPDPKNSYLMGLNQVIQTILWTADDQGGLGGDHGILYRLAINASTLRATLRLTGTTDKDSNLGLAYGYVPKDLYPALDSDSCDAVLLAMMGRYAVQVFRGEEDLVPIKPRCTLCSLEVKQKFRTDKVTGEKVVSKETPRGILHDPLTWTQIVAPQQVTLGVADASTTARAVNTTFII